MLLKRKDMLDSSDDFLKPPDPKDFALEQGSITIHACWYCDGSENPETLVFEHTECLSNKEI